MSNDQCTLSGAGGGVSVGASLRVPFAVTFASSFNGQKNVLGYAQSYSGANDGWQQLGTWTPATGGTLTAASVHPTNGGGFGPNTFTVSYTDSNGGTDIQAAYLDFGSSVLSGGSCIAVYVKSGNALYLFTDSNGAALGPITAGSSSTVSNSQCTLSGLNGTATASGNGLLVPFNIMFPNAFNSTQAIFGMAQSYGGTQSAWANLGTWTP